MTLIPIQKPTIERSAKLVAKINKKKYFFKRNKTKESLRNRIYQA